MIVELHIKSAHLNASRADIKHEYTPTDSRKKQNIIRKKKNLSGRITAVQYPNYLLHLRAAVKGEFADDIPAAGKPDVSVCCGQAVWRAYTGHQEESSVLPE